MDNKEQERIYATIEKAKEIENKLDNANKKTRQRAFVKILSLFAAVIILVVSIIVDVETHTLTILDSTLYALFFLIIITILSLDTLSEMVKERENSVYALRLDVQNDNILSLQKKYDDLDKKYNELLKEVPKQ